MILFVAITSFLIGQFFGAGLVFVYAIFRARAEYHRGVLDGYDMYSQYLTFTMHTVARFV